MPPPGCLRRDASALSSGSLALHPARPPATQDFEGGHIKGAFNRTSDEFASDERIDAVVRACAGASRVVFHCLLSQVRGPRAAQRFAARLAARRLTEPPRVQVLRGGFSGFSALHASHPQLFEDFSEAHWRA